MGKKPANPNRDLNEKSNNAQSPGGVEINDTPLLNRAMEKADPDSVNLRNDQVNNQSRMKKDFI